LAGLFAPERRDEVRVRDARQDVLGTRDDRGDFRALASDSALNEVGIGFPPYHGLCRSTTLAVV
jgi:hypothetical protein